MINAGVTCLKIEGRMKSPEYVATVTRFYRKYIDLAESDRPYVIDEQDKKIYSKYLIVECHLLVIYQLNLIKI